MSRAFYICKRSRGNAHFVLSGLDKAIITIKIGRALEYSKALENGLDFYITIPDQVQQSRQKKI